MADKPESSDKLAEKTTAASDSKEIERKIPGYPNLKPFPKGTSGFAGRTHKKPVLSTAYGELMEQFVPRIKPPITFAQAIAKGIVKEAMKGNHSAAKEIADRLEGTSRQRVELTMTDSNSVDIEAMSDAELKQLIMAEVIRRKALEEK